MLSFNGLDLNGLIFAVAKLTDGNTRKTYLQVIEGGFMLRTLGYTTHDQYQRKLDRNSYLQLCESFRWNEQFMAWELRNREIKGQKLVDVIYILSTANGGKLGGVEMLKNRARVAVGAAGIWDQQDYRNYQGQNLFERVKSLLSWNSTVNAWEIPLAGKSDAAVNVMKYKTPPKASYV